MIRLTNLFIWTILTAVFFECVLLAPSPNYHSCLARPEHGQESGYVEFIELAVKNKHRCTELRRNDCLFYHECTQKCSCVCQELITSGSDSLGGVQANPNVGPGPGPAPYQECFHGDEMVRTNVGDMKLSQIVRRPDISVLTRGPKNDLQMSPIQYWTHANENVKTDFIVFSTESGRNISLSAFHLIYETDCLGNSRTVFSKRVTVGKCLYVVDDEGKLIESKVIERRIDKKSGIYAPITTTGNIVVNGVLASCYTNIENEAVQRLIYSYFMRFHYVLKHILPESLLEAFFGSPFSATVEIPYFFYSFANLAKTFVRLN